MITQLTVSTYLLWNKMQKWFKDFVHPVLFPFYAICHKTTEWLTRSIAKAHGYDIKYHCSPSNYMCKSLPPWTCRWDHFNWFLIFNHNLVLKTFKKYLKVLKTRLWLKIKNRHYNFITAVHLLFFYRLSLWSAVILMPKKQTSTQLLCLWLCHFHYEKIVLIIL